MIVDHIRNREKYYFLGEAYKTALDYFATVSSGEFDETDIKLDNEVVIKARPMSTKEIKDCSFEAHRKFADIHFVVYGKEKIGYTDINKLGNAEYNEESDVAFFEGEGDLITLLPGYFLIALADDVHMPCVCVNEPEKLGKMIAKIKL